MEPRKNLDEKVVRIRAFDKKFPHFYFKTSELIPFLLKQCSQRVSVFDPSCLLFRVSLNVEFPRRGMLQPTALFC